MLEWFIAPIAAVIAIAFGLYLRQHVKKQDAGNTKMQEIAGAIEEGAYTFLRREYTYLAIFVVVVAAILGLAIDPLMFPIFIFGSICSAAAGYIGMNVALKTNVRTAQAAKNGLNKAFSIAFSGGAVMGLSVVSLAVLGMSIVYYLTGSPMKVLGFSFGASFTALFAKAGGGIYTKTADIGADLVGKIEMNLVEDDPRNPAVIADNVGDNVGDVAGMGADLFDSYVASIMIAMVLGFAIGPIQMIIPLVFAGLGIISSIIGVLLVRNRQSSDPGKALNWGTYTTCIIFGVLTLATTYFLGYDIRIWGSSTVGLIAGVLIGITSDFFTSSDRTPTQRTAEASKTGAALNIITGYSYGELSVFLPSVGIAIALGVSWYLNAQYGVAMSAVGMLSIVGLIISSDAYGPIVDNSKGIAEQSGLGEEVIKIADRLDEVGNTAKAVTKGFAIGAAGLTVVSLFAGFQEIAHSLTNKTIEFNLLDPLVLIGVFIGTSMPLMFSAMVKLGVAKNAFRMVEEIRRQFREIPGLIEGKAKPDYKSCVDIAAKGALKELLLPSLVCIIATLAVGFLLGVRAVGGFIGGSIFIGIPMALLMANAGGLWDNAKKYIEDGAYGGKGSEAHKAAVIGDTVGDPFKDTAGPSLNTLITVMSLVASEFAALFVLYALVEI